MCQTPIYWSFALFLINNYSREELIKVIKESYGIF
jgi:hypothetical protein